MSVNTTKPGVKYAYEGQFGGGDLSCPFDSIEDMLQDIANEGGDPEEMTFYECKPGNYLLPPSTPATVVFY